MIHVTHTHLSPNTELLHCHISTSVDFNLRCMTGNMPLTIWREDGWRMAGSVTDPYGLTHTSLFSHTAPPSAAEDTNLFVRERGIAGLLQQQCKLT